jgi:hypothetical protein
MSSVTAEPQEPCLIRPKEVNRPIHKILRKLPFAVPTSNGYMARCPSHDDQRPSLSISEAEDGTVLLNCFGPCSTEEVIESLGLTFSDLFPRDADESPRESERVEVDIPDRCAWTPDPLIEELERKHGPTSARYEYFNDVGAQVGVILRWDGPEGKLIRPISRVGSMWRISGMSAPRPLYRLRELADAHSVYVTEGEKAADAARSIGLVSTTSAHGAKSAKKTDWTPLAGKTVVILPDHDTAGKKYAEDIAAIVTRLTPPATVKIVELPGLPEGGDIVDRIAAQGDAADPAELRRQIEAMLEAAPVWQPPRPAKPSEPAIEPWWPFPVEVLPEPIRSFVIETAAAIGCDMSFVALPLLAALASAIGNTTVVELKRGWVEPSVIWSVTVGDSGSLKTPGWQKAIGFLSRKQTEALVVYKAALAQYEIDQLKYDAQFRDWRTKGHDKGDPPAKPIEPVAERRVISDATVEGLVAVLEHQHRGILLARDELSGWCGSFGRYSGGKGGSDVAAFLEMHRAGRLTQDRKTGRRFIDVPRAAVSITGSIQPETLKRALATEHIEDGLASRLLFAWPPKRRRRWSEAEVPASIENNVKTVFDRLLALPFADCSAKSGSHEQAEPVVLTLDPQAKTAWIEFVNLHGEEQCELNGALASAWSKLEGYAARLALAVHLVRWAASDASRSNPGPVDLVSIQAGIALSRWFSGEARRVYTLLSETPEQQSRRALVEWIQRCGRGVTCRDLARKSHIDGEAAEAALHDLVNRGYGSWEPVPPGPQGGRPTIVFRLSDQYACDTTAQKSEDDGVLSQIEPNAATKQDWEEGVV